MSFLLDKEENDGYGGEGIQFILDNHGIFVNYDELVFSFPRHSKPSPIFAVDHRLIDYDPDHQTLW